MARTSNLASSTLASAEALAARTPRQQEDVVIDPKELADRYVAVWIEPDTEQRRKSITQLWAEDGVHVLEPPQEVRETAATHGHDPTLKARARAPAFSRSVRSCGLLLRVWMPTCSS
jgi:hypothetical protein